MSGTLLRALFALTVASALFCCSIVLIHRLKTLDSSLQLLGTIGFMVVVLTHVCEGLDVFPWMGWGHESSADHYLDLVSAILGITSFSMGLLLNRFSKRHA
jgi:hypothetical protein